MRIAIVGLAAVLAAAGAAEPKPLVNADFESFEKDGHPTGWELPPGTGWSIAANEGVNGLHALCYDGDKVSNGRGIPLQWVEIDRSKKYLIEGRVRTVGLTGGGASICLQCHDKNGNVFYGKYSHDMITGTTDDWVKIIVRMVVSIPSSSDATSSSSMVKPFLIRPPPET